MLSPTPLIHDHVQLASAVESAGAPWPSSLNRILSPEMAEAALEEITQWPGYRQTPLASLSVLAERLGLAEVTYKDESARFTLNSFKALGGAYAVLLQAAHHSGLSLDKVRKGEARASLAGLTVATATDGNHGRSVAWGAQMAGCACRIYIHAEVSEGRKQAMEAFGAEVVRVDGDYDESVRACAKAASENGWIVVSDTSYDGYMNIPRQVMAGYSVMASEILSQATYKPPTHVFVQAGVGGLAAAVCARFWQSWGAERPRMIIVEPTLAACLTESAKKGTPSMVPVLEETVMAGLSCGEASLLAWEILSQGATDYLTIDDDAIAAAMILLGKGEAGGGRIVAGESAVPGLVALAGVMARPDLRQAMGLTPESRVLLLGSEGASDPEIYTTMTGLEV